MKQELVQKEANELGTETKEKRELTASVRKIGEDGVTVDLTTDIMRAEATLVQNGDQEERILDFSEEQETSSHTIPFEDSVYKDVVQADYWQLVEELREEEASVVAERPQLTGWELLSLMWRPVNAILLAPTDTQYELPGTSQGSGGRLSHTIQDKRIDGRRFFHMAPVSWRRQDEFEYVHPEAGNYDPELDTQEPAAHLYPSAPLDTAATYTEEHEPVPATDPVPLEPDQSRMDETAVHRLEYGTDLEEQSETRLTYRVDEDLAEQDTVKNTLLELVERGDVEATIVKQPFYSPEAFGDDGEYHDAGWQDGFYGVVQLEGMDMDMTEFSVNGELAMDGIDSIAVDEGDHITFESSEEYTCGVAQNQEEHEAAWQDRYGIDMNTFDSVTERGVYAAMMEGYAFEGAPLDLSLYENAREVYVENVGRAPENVLDNVVYRP